MTFREEVLRLTRKNKGFTHDMSITCLGLSGELSEVFELEKVSLDKTKLLKEFGDLRWYFEFGSIHLEFETYSSFSKIEKEVDSKDLGISIGKFNDYVKKVLYNGHTINKEKAIGLLNKSFNDFYNLISQYGFTLKEVEDNNSEKMRERYKDGFTSEESIKRRDEQ